MLDRSTEVNLARAEDHPFVGNAEPAKSVWLFYVQNNLFVHKQFVVESQVVAVGIQAFLAKGSDANICTLPCPDFFA